MDGFHSLCSLEWGQYDKKFGIDAYMFVDAMNQIEGVAIWCFFVK
jgi:hypothetical protein